MQLCFIVDNVETQRARLEGAGVHCDPVVGEAWGRYASFRDPEGNWLQIFEVFDCNP
jgi:predicted enzyme related to lactoylglutathione lyase